MSKETQTQKAKRPYTRRKKSTNSATANAQVIGEITLIPDSQENIQSEAQIVLSKESIYTTMTADELRDVIEIKDHAFKIQSEALSEKQSTIDELLSNVNTLQNDVILASDVVNETKAKALENQLLASQRERSLNKIPNWIKWIFGA